MTRGTTPELRAPPMLDAMGGLAAAVVVCALTALDAHIGPLEAGTRPAGFLGYLLVAAGGAVLAFRNVAPAAAFAAALALGVAYQGAGYVGGPAPLTIAIALYAVAAHGRRQLSLGFGLIAIVVLVGVRGLAVRNGFESPLLVAFPTTVIVALYIGQLVASRRQSRADEARFAGERERLREEEARRRVDAERLRIARELHDIVAHHISLINVQATMGVHLMNDQPGQAAAALIEIKTASRQALGELRRILQVLRQVDDVEPTAPAPGLSGLGAMVASTQAAGLPVTVAVLGDSVPLPASVDATAYRIIQESLTNALRYAAPAPASVMVRYGADRLILEVRDVGQRHVPQDTPASGHGIAGMRERAAAVGGTLDAVPVPGGGFRVHASLPLSPQAP